MKNKRIRSLIKSCLIIFILSFSLLGNSLFEIANYYLQELNVVDKFFKAQTNDNVVDKFSPLEKILEELDIPKAQAAANGDGKIFYSIAANTTPRTRDYISSSNSFNTAASTVAGSTALQSVIKASPTKDEFIAGYVNASGILQVMCYNGSSWSNEWSVSVGGTGTTRRFDIAYETNSGDVIVAYSRNAAATNAVDYRTKPGASACGTANWASAASMPTTTSLTTGTVHWVKAAWDIRSAQNLIAVIWADSNADLGASIWSGSAFGNFPTLTQMEQSLEVVTAAQDVEDFDVEYESTSGDVMMVWANSAGANGTNGAFYNVCTGGTSACTWGTRTAMPTILDDATHLDIAGDPNSDKILYGAIGNAGSDLNRGVWSGSGWTNSAGDAACAAPLAGTMFVAVGWLNNGATNRGVLAYYDSGTTNIGWNTVSGTTWTANTDWASTPVFGVQKSYKFDVDPFNKNRLIFSLNDANSDIFAKRLIMDAAGAFTWTDSAGGNPVEANTASATYRTFDYAYNRYIPAPTNPDAASFVNNTDGTLADGGRSSQQITITGTTFGVDPGAGNRSTATNNVKIGGSGGYQIPDANVSSWSDTTIVFTIPAACTSYGGATTNGLLVTAGSQSDLTPLTFYVYPNITGVGAAKTVGDITATITGDHLGTTRTMTVNGVSATITGGNETSITFTVPDTISGIIIVSITAPITKTSNNNQNFQILPKVTTISTTSGDSGSTYSGLSLTGSGFQAVSSVTLTLGSQTVIGSSFTLSNKNSITGGSFNLNNATPGPTAAYAGIWNVNLTINDAIFGAASTTYASSFTVRPKIIAPTPIEALQGATITITGYGFGTAGTLYINNNGTAITESIPGVTWTNTSISGVLIPSDATINTGGMSITVGTVQNSPVYGFTVLPQITSLSVTEGRVGDTITINGNHLGSSAGTISINSASATGTWGDTSITGVAIPLAGTIDGSVTITTNATYGTKTSNGISFTILPRITSIDVTASTSGTPIANGITEARQTDTIRINGDHFGTAGTIAINGAAATGTYSDTQITAISVPNGTISGSIVVTRTTPAPNKDSNGFTFLILPRITSIDVTASTSGTPIANGVTEARQTDTIRINGDHFGTAGTIAINGAAATGTYSDTQITAISVPNGTISGSIVVTRTTPAPNKDSNGFTFLILPRVTSITAEGRVGDTVIISGDHFGASRGTGKVTFGSTDAPSGDYVSWGDASIEVKVQNDSGYTVNVKVTRDGGKESNTDKTILILPQITSINPTSGRIGDIIQIDGNHFGVASGNITLDGQNSSTAVTWGENSITNFTIPNTIGSGQSLNFVVTRNSDSKLSNNFAITILSRITSVTAEARVGDSITITGDHFSSAQGAGKVTIGTTDVTSGLTWSDTSISFSLPNDSGYTVNVMVTRNDSTTSNSDKTLLILPQITGLTGSVGANSSYEGDVITINGNHFGTAGTIVINGQTVSGTYTANSISNITVPNGTDTGNIVVTRTTPAPNKNSNNWAFTILPKIISVDVTASSYGTPVSNGVTEARFEDTITINGNHFGAAGTITINGAAATGTYSANQIIGISVPNGTISGNIIIQRTADSVNSNNFAFTILPRVTGFLCGVSPCTAGTPGDGATMGAGGGGTLVTIQGDHFGVDPGSGNRSSGTHNIKFKDFNGNLTVVTPGGDFDTVSPWADTAIKVYIPGGSNSGPVDGGGRIQVTAGSKTSNLDAANTRFDIKPRILSIVPNNAVNDNPVSVNITGQGFQAKSASTDSRLIKSGQSDIVSLNADITVSGSTSMSAIYDITSKTEGYWKVQVTNSEGYIGEYGDGSTTGFRVNVAPPTVTSVDPSVGTQNDTALVLTIGGTNFVNMDAIEPCFLQQGGTKIVGTGLIVDSNTQIRCTFNLSSQPLGKYDVNAKTQVATGTLSQGFEILSSVPQAPQNLYQFKNNTDTAQPPTTNLAVGAAINQTTVWFRVDMTAGVAGNLTPQVEVKSADPMTPFDGTGVTSGSPVIYDTPGETVQGWVSVSITNGNKYHWRARVSNFNGSSTWVVFDNNADEVHFRCDTQAPTISNISTSGISDVSATINWTVNENATGQIEYNTTGSWPGTLHPSSPSGYGSGNQSITLVGLTASTTYYYRIRAVDEAGNEAISTPNESFVTLATRPLKTVELFIGQDIQVRASGESVAGGMPFTIYIPENTPTIKSAFFEVTGVSASASPQVITADIGGQNSKTFNLSTGNNSYFHIYYDATSYFNGIITQPGTYPPSGSYYLNLVGNGASVSLWGAKLSLTYTYLP